MAQKQQNNIRQYRKPINLNLGMLIFSAIFVYVVIGVFLYFTREHIRPYEVQMGSLAVSNIYKGIALRDEEVVTSKDSGYINYYAREGQRVGVGNLVYTVDESGRIADLIAGYEGDTGALTDTDLNELKTEIVGFAHEFDETNFSSVYDFKYSVKGTVLKLANNSILAEIDSMQNTSSADLVKRSYSPKSGIILYSVDGYENKTAADITMADFDQSTYDKQQLISNDLISSGDTAYKLSLSETWSIVIPVEQARLDELVEEEYVKVRFLKNQQESWAQVNPLTNADGSYAELIFNNSMITFSTDRFVDIELVTNDEKGLKIPNSAIVEKEFFLVPIEYVTQGGKNDEYGVLRQRYEEDGSATTEFIQTSIYNKTETEYYLDDTTLRIGDYLVKPDSTETYPVSKRASLLGVYNMNKGYADFKQIIILYQNDEYSIVQSGTDYGLSTYDYIVLDAQTVNENDFIYE